MDSEEDTSGWIPLDNISPRRSHVAVGPSFHPSHNTSINPGSSGTVNNPSIQTDFHIQSHLHSRRLQRLRINYDTRYHDTHPSPAILDVAQKDESFMSGWLSDSQTQQSQDEEPHTPEEQIRLSYNGMLGDEESQIHTPARARESISTSYIEEPSRYQTPNVLGVENQTQLGATSPGPAFSPQLSSTILGVPGLSTNGETLCVPGQSNPNPTRSPARQTSPLRAPLKAAGRSTARSVDESSIHSSRNSLDGSPSHVFYNPSLVDSDTANSSFTPTADDISRMEPIGRTLFYFGSNSGLRRFLHRMISSQWFPLLNICLTLAEVVVICIETIHAFKTDGTKVVLFSSTWTWYFYIVLFSLLTAMSTCQIVAFGAFTVKVITRQEIASITWKQVCSYVQIIVMGPSAAGKIDTDLPDLWKPEQLCYFRKSWNRVEAISLSIFWIWIGLAYHLSDLDPIILILSGLPHLRVLRLLDYSTYTRVVLQALKIALPMLQNILIFMVFFLLIFSITGLQSFNSSLRRMCMYPWTDSTGADQLYISSQNCGAYLSQNGTTLPFLDVAGIPTKVAKGFVCPIGSQCVELTDDQFQSGQMSFDNILYAFEMVFIIMSMNSYSPIMYNIIDAEYDVSCLFFIFGILVLGMWLVNLLVAVLVQSFQIVRHTWVSSEFRRAWAPIRTFQREANGISDLPHLEIFPTSYLPDSSENPPNPVPRVQVTSADADISTDSRHPIHDDGNSTRSSVDNDNRNQYTNRTEPYDPYKDTVVGRIYYMAFPLLAILPVLDLVFKSLWHGKPKLFTWDVILAIVFAIEIVIRFSLYRHHWLQLLVSSANVFDLLLAIANLIVLAFHGTTYDWLAFFQVLRFYRAIAVFTFARNLWQQLIGNYRIIVNVTIFYFSMTFLASLVVSKMLRGQFSNGSDSEADRHSFFNLGDTFLNLYQLSSTENWTDILFYATENSRSIIAAACMGILFCMWLFFSGMLVLNLFIAVMTENLSLDTGKRRQEQVRMYAKEYLRDTLTSRESTWISESKPVRLMRSYLELIWPRLRARRFRKKFKGVKTVVEQELIQEFLRNRGQPIDVNTVDASSVDIISSNHIGQTARGLNSAQNPHRRRQTSLFTDVSSHPLFQRFKGLAKSFVVIFSRYPKEYRQFMLHELSPNVDDQGVVSDLYAYRILTRNTLRSYREINPSFDKPLFLFSMDSSIRKLCQRIVPSSYGERASGITPTATTTRIVRLLLVAATIAMVVNTCLYTPLTGLETPQSDKWTSTRIIDVAFGIFFTIEFAIKVTADGLYFTPNAYTLSPWNLIDFVALLAIWATFITEIAAPAASRYTRGLLALRALRLVSYNHKREAIFRAIVLRGLPKIFGGVCLALAFIVPYSVWGTLIFSDKLLYCNDANIESLKDCLYEYEQSIYDWNVVAPRSIQRQYLHFDSFGKALWTNFSILSLEGWVDVMGYITSIVNHGLNNPQTDANRFNALYTVLYNYIGTVLLMSMFVAIVIRHYAESCGTAFLTSEQLEWLDTKRMLSNIFPVPKGPKYRSSSARDYLLKSMVDPQGWYTSLEYWTLLILTAVLFVTHYPESHKTAVVMNIFTLSSSTLFTCLEILRLFILQPRLFFHRFWSVLDISVPPILAGTSLYMLVGGISPTAANFNRAACITTLLLWIPRIGKLNQLFYIAMRSYSELESLLEAWFSLFLTYAIAFNQTFGLVKLGDNTTSTKNFRNVPNALMALFTMSTGEGWNAVLDDFLVKPPYCVQKDNFSECGDSFLAYLLFSTWNIISMYIFANIFVSLVVESFWYVRKRGPTPVQIGDSGYFIEAWQQMDPKGRGYASIKSLSQVMMRCQGYYSLGIYSTDPYWNVHAILSRAPAHIPRDPYDVDLAGIESVLDDLPVAEIKKRRETYELFMTHMSLLTDEEGQIGFNELLRSVPLYKDVDPNQVLTMKEFIDLKMLLRQAKLINAGSFIAQRWKKILASRQSSMQPSTQSNFEKSADTDAD